MRKIKEKVVLTPKDFGSLDRRESTNMVVIHHTGNPKDDNLSVEEIHASHKGQGWSGCGYHYVIRKDGMIETGRPLWAVGAHAYGYNSRSVGIHVCGNFEAAKPTPAQIESLALLIANVCAWYDLPLHSVLCHKDLMATACPGKNLYNLFDTIIGKAIWYQNHD